MEWKMLAPCLFGLERIVKFELQRIGASNIRAEDGRVYFNGDERVLALANFTLQTAERVQIVLAEFEADSFEALFEGTKAIRWENFLKKETAFPVKGWSLSSKLKSVPACQSIVKKAVVERLKSAYHLNWLEETAPPVQISFSILKDKASILIDTSGAPLHKRGYRAVANEAPIKETLASGIADLAGVRANSLVMDPLCGSGTLLIESALRAQGRAVGLNRSFAFFTHPYLSGEIIKIAKEEAEEMKRPSQFVGYGWDIDPASVKIARENVKKAGLSHCITIEQREVADFEPVGEGGIVLANPPYGDRLLDEESCAKLYQTMGKRFVKKDGLSYGIITSDLEFETHFGRKATKKRKLYNGMKRCDLYLFD